MTSVFETENITRITFYAYYGGGEGSKVPEMYMAEITRWLGTFAIDKKAEDVALPRAPTLIMWKLNIPTEMS